LFIKYTLSAWFLSNDNQFLQNAQEASGNSHFPNQKILPQGRGRNEEKEYKFARFFGNNLGRIWGRNCQKGLKMGFGGKKEATHKVL